MQVTFGHFWSLWSLLVTFGHFWSLLVTSFWSFIVLSGHFVYFRRTSEYVFHSMKKLTLPSLDELKETGSPYLDIEIAATRKTIDQGLDEGYSLKTIYRTLFDSGDITGTYSGFRRAFRRNGSVRDYTDEISVNTERGDTRKSRSARESEAALAEAKEALAARAQKK